MIFGGRIEISSQVRGLVVGGVAACFLALSEEVSAQGTSTQEGNEPTVSAETTSEGSSEDSVEQQEVEELQNSLTDRDPLEAIAAQIVANAKGDRELTSRTIEQAEAVAAQLASALLASGDTAEMQRFVDLFYGNIYPQSDVESVKGWKELSSRAQAAKQSIEIQFLNVQARLSTFNAGLTAPISQLVTPSELLEFPAKRIEPGP